MNNKILIGSIIAISILIGVSFTSVVGYRSLTSDVKASPLFTIRTSRAIDEESEELRCEYVGKGLPILISLPKRMPGYLIIQKLFYILSKIDKKSLQKDFQNKFTENELISEIYNKINKLNGNFDIQYEFNSSGPTSQFDTVVGCCPVFTVEPPSEIKCFLFFLFFIIFVFLPWIIYNFILDIIDFIMDIINSW